MKLDETVAWYQKKIGTYDKQEWEKTIEQRVLDGIATAVTLKNAKLKTELIDVDLVRGSTFPKAKPKQGLLTVIRLAVLRCLFLPLYTRWWVKQTSPNIFAVLFMLYVTQMVNWSLFTLYARQDTANGQRKFQSIAGNSTAADGDEQVYDAREIMLTELMIPLLLSLILSLIHAQIVATYTPSGAHKGGKQSRFSSGSGKNVRARRRKKLTRFRQTELAESTPKSASLEAISAHIDGLCDGGSGSLNTKLDLLTQQAEKEQNDENKLRKRNVNWHTPLHNYASQTLHKQLQAAPQMSNITTQTSVASSSTSSLAPSNSNTTSSVETSPITEASNRRLRQNEARLQNRRAEQQPAVGQPQAIRRVVGEDDGFESLNGKSSSGEDAPPTPRPASASGSNSSGSAAQRLNIAAQPSKSSARLSYSSGVAEAKVDHSTDDTDDGGDEGEHASSSNLLSPNVLDCTTSASEWQGITTNSEEVSCSSEMEQSDGVRNFGISEDEHCDQNFTPATILSPHGSLDRVSCTIWERHEAKKAQLSVLEISSCIIDRVESLPESNDYIYIGVFFSFILSFVPTTFRLYGLTIYSDKSEELSYFDLPLLLWERASFSFGTLFGLAFGCNCWEQAVLMLAFAQRLALTLILFLLFAVAERTYKQRFLYTKLFSHITSSRRAHMSKLPHFRLNKVRNIKSWLSVRSYLKKRGPQRSADVIVSAAFVITLLFLAFLSVECLKETVHLHAHLCLEALMWSITIGIFLLRFMTLGNKINQKCRCVSVIITEQINLYLQIEQKPKKKEELMVANSVLKLAADLLKELEEPFKISGLSANPYLFTTIKVVILSALSGVLSEVLGFKLKLHKIKIK